MSPLFYAHPLSSYCQKVLIALYENATPFEFRSLGPDTPQHAAEWLRRWPLRKFPLLIDDERTVVETSIIIEHLELHHPGPVRLLPEDPRAALAVRFLDRRWRWRPSGGGARGLPHGPLQFADSALQRGAFRACGH